MLDMLSVWLLIILGFIILIKSSNFLVDGASSIARHFNISHLVIALTVVSLGTTSPEFFVSITSSASGQSEFILSGVLGSIMVNILFILGLHAIIHPVKVSNGLMTSQIPFSLVALLVIWIMGMDLKFSLTEGIILLCLTFFYILFTLFHAKKTGHAVQDAKKYHPLVSVLHVFLGCIGLYIGSQLVVRNAVVIASALGISPFIIGLTIIAAGTSLPEFATSMTAALKKQSDIAIGNIVGSNILNLIWILGIGVVVKPFTLMEDVNVSFAISLLAILLLISAFFIGKKRVIERPEGIIMVVVYMVYIVSLVL